MGAILVTHNVDEAVLLGDSICVLSEGRIVKKWRGVTGAERSALSGAALELREEILLSIMNYG